MKQLRVGGAAGTEPIEIPLLICDVAAVKINVLLAVNFSSSVL